MAERSKLEAESLVVAIAEAEVCFTLDGMCIGCDRICQSQAFDKISRLLHFIRLHLSLSAQHPRVSSLGIDDSEIPIILAAAEQLLGEESEIRQELVRGLLYGEGEFQGVSREVFFFSNRRGTTFDYSDQTRDSLIWHMPSQLHKPNLTLPLLRNLVLRSQNHWKRCLVSLKLALVGKNQRRGNFASCKKASSTIPLRTVKNGWTFLKIK